MKWKKGFHNLGSICFQAIIKFSVYWSLTEMFLHYFLITQWFWRRCSRVVYKLDELHCSLSPKNSPYYIWWNYILTLLETRRVGKPKSNSIFKLLRRCQECSKTTGELSKRQTLNPNESSYTSYHQYYDIEMLRFGL